MAALGAYLCPMTTVTMLHPRTRSEAILIAFTRVSQPEEGACRSRRERSSLPDIGSNRSASWAPVGVARDLPTRHPLSRLLRPVGVGADQISLSSAPGCRPRRGRLL